MEDIQQAHENGRHASRHPDDRRFWASRGCVKCLDEGQCMWSEWHRGIPGVDDLRGDDGFEVRCDNASTAVATYRSLYDGEVDDWMLCPAHLSEFRTDAAVNCDIEILDVTEFVAMRTLA